MTDIKRILWIDDYPNNEASYMFSDIETKRVSTMDEAIDEIAGEHLYDYDTIVLDIDFENGLPDGEQNVLEKLSQKIYLSKDQRNKNYIINNGGYLLFLYLLEKGYPSEQVAFLTGNKGIIEQLKSYTNQNLTQLSKHEILEAFVSAWNESDDDIDLFQEQIDSLPVDIKYKESDFVIDCAEALESENKNKLETLINEITPVTVTGNIQNTGDMMIFRFHEANLESPIYFSKNNNDIDGHNRIDAEEWLTSRRSDNMVTRWLLLDAANYIEMLFRDDQMAMERQVGNLFKIENEDDGEKSNHRIKDPGIRSAFRQMFFVFDGLRNIERRGIYYQAVSAMLIPFDKDIKPSGRSANIPNLPYKNVQKMLARFSKQTRNYCAHNYFGSTLSNKTVLYIIACTLLGVLSDNQARKKATWFEKIYYTLSDNNSYSIEDNLKKIDILCQRLLDEDKIDIESAHVDTDYANYSSLEMLRALGYNKEMGISFQPSTRIREEYYVFTLASYVVKWFDRLPIEDVKNNQGECVSIIYELSNEIVDKYIYPNE